VGELKMVAELLW